MSSCSCGSDSDWDACCGSIIDGKNPALTAEALMRARYSAHVNKQYEFLKTSSHPEFREEIDSDEIEEWSSSLKWEGLQVHSTDQGGIDDATGQVRFSAFYTQNGHAQEMREDAFFRKEDGVWYYVEGSTYGQDSVRRLEPKIGRNDVCPCGSGKKYKKCCLAKEA